ncbi:MAG: LPS export ABC transporter periplasmic protein LptC [Rhodomicrobium sp.]
MAIAAAPAGRNKPPIGQPARGMRGGQGVDRAREFRRATRHSVLVRVLKVVLPLIAAGVLSLYALPSLLVVSIDKGRGEASVRAVTLEAGSLKMLEPRVRGVNDKNEAYEFVADTATQASRTAETMYMEKVRGHVTGRDGVITKLTAPDGIHNGKADEMTFNNGAVVTRDPDFTATFKTATAFMKQQMVISKTPVVVRLHESTIHSDGMTLFWNEQRAIFEGNVRTHIERQTDDGVHKAPTPQPPASPAGAAPASGQ